uniref:HMG box domain-containing protein n=1 Tax=Lynx canadensis TaxID=61383 RepID=A0A667G850_LYNCA
MDASYDGTEVTVVMEEIEEAYCYTSPGPPKKKKKYKIHGEKAKKPRSAYLLYYYDIYLKVQQELPHLPQSEINKKISESWRLLSVAERSYYLEKAKLEKEGLDPEKPAKVKVELAPGVSSKGSVVKRNQQPVTTEQNSSKENASKLTLENSEAEAPGNRGTAATKTPVVKNGVPPEVSLGTTENDSPGPDIPPPAERTSTSSPPLLPKACR